MFGVTFILNRLPPVTSTIVALCLISQVFSTLQNGKWPALVEHACVSQPEAGKQVQEYVYMPAQTLFRIGAGLGPTQDTCSSTISAILKTDNLRHQISKDKNLREDQRVALLQSVDRLESESGKYWRNQAGSDPHRWRPSRSVTSEFVHGGWLQLVFNMAFFWLFAGAVELLLGSGKFLAYTLASAMVGDFIFSTYVYLSGTWAAPTVGSQGIVLAVMGMFVFLFPDEKMRFKRDAPNPEDVTVIDLHPAWLILIFIFGICLGPINPTHDSLDFYSYVASLGCGLFCGMAFSAKKRRASRF